MKKEITKFDDIVYTEGLPCHKFILKSLTTINDAKVFTKNYIATMKDAGMEDDAIIDSLVFFSSIASGLDGRYDFTSWDRHISGYTLIDDVCFDTDVAEYKSCRQFYRKYDAKYTACDLCPRSSRYKNANMASEKTVVLYALSSRENLEYVFSKGISEEHFNSVTDVIARKTASTKPCLYSFYKQTMVALKDDSICDDIFSLGDYEPILEKYHSKKISRMSSITSITKETKDCAFSLNTFCAVMISEMLDGSVCSKNEVDKCIKNLISGTDENEVQQKESRQDSTIGTCNMGVDAINGFYERAPELQESTTQSDESTKTVSDDKAVSDDKSKFVHITLDSILANMNSLEEPVSDKETVDEQFETAETIVSSETLDIKEDDESTLSWDSVQNFFSTPANIDDENDDCDVESNVPSSVYVSYQGKLLSSSYITSDQDIDTDYDEPVIELTEIKEEGFLVDNDDDLMAIPIVGAKELAHFALNLDIGSSHLLSLFESHVMKDKRLSLEIVYEEQGGYYLLIYCPRLHAYFYTKFRNEEVNEVLMPIMSHPSVEKFCYYPYAVIGVLRQIGVTVKGLYSLFSVSSVLYPNHHYNMRMMLEELGATRAEGGVTIHPEGTIESVALLYMHSYHTIFYRMRRKMLRDGLWNEFEDTNTFDTVLSLSYYQSVYSKERTTLFRLRGAGRYIFPSNVPTTFNHPGKCITLVFRHAPESTSSWVINLLCEMYRRGMFYKCGIMILSLGEEFVSLYIKSEHVEYVETRLNRILLKYLHETRARGLEYSLREIKDGRVVIAEDL